MAHCSQDQRFRGGGRVVSGVSGWGGLGSGKRTDWFILRNRAVEHMGRRREAKVMRDNAL